MNINFEDVAYKCQKCGGHTEAMIGSGGLYRQCVGWCRTVLGTEDFIYPTTITKKE